MVQWGCRSQECAGLCSAGSHRREATPHQARLRATGDGEKEGQEEGETTIRRSREPPPRHEQQSVFFAFAVEASIRAAASSSTDPCTIYSTGTDSYG
jgi:hypothetical protein